MADNALIVTGRFDSALAEASSILDVKGLRDYAEGARRYAKARSMGIEAENMATTAILRAERKIGMMLDEMIASGTLAKQGERKAQGVVVYEDLGFRQQDAYSWRQAAHIPEDAFEEMISLATRSGTRLAKVNFYRKARSPEGDRALATKEDSGFEAFREGANALLGWRIGPDGVGAPTRNGLKQLPNDELAQIARIIKHMYEAYQEAKAAR